MKKYNKCIWISVVAVMLCSGCGVNDGGRTVNNKNSVDAVMQNEINKSSDNDQSQDIQLDDSQANTTEEYTTEESTEESTVEQDVVSDSNVDIDISVMNSDMIYATVYQLMSTPETYIGQKIKIKGNHYSSYYEQTGLTYHYALIQDAAACCAQGLEFELKQGLSYPEEEEEVIVTGIFETYDEEGVTYCRLGDAVIQ